MSARSFRLSQVLFTLSLAALSVACGDALVGASCEDGFTEIDGQCVPDAQEAQSPTCPRETEPDAGADADTGADADAGEGGGPTGES